MGKIRYLIISCIMLFILSATSVLGGPYDLEGTDPTDDVKDIENNGNLTSEYPDLDITYAKVQESGDNVIFTLQVLGDIVPNDPEMRYVFSVIGDNNSNYIDVYFKNPYKCYAFRMDPFFKKDCTYELVENNKVVITAPKSAFEGIDTPWEVTAKAKVYISRDRVLDELELSYETQAPTEETGESSTTNELPSFQAITIIIVLFMAILIVVAIIFVFWNKKKQSR